MRRHVLAVALLLLMPLPALAEAATQPLPAPAEAMIRAAAGNDAQLSVASDTARKAFPKSKAQIDKLVRTLRLVATIRHQAKLRHIGLLRGWKGHGQLGATSTSGNTRTTGVAFGLDLQREGLAWTHEFNSSFDYQRDNGVETKSRYFASFQSNYRFSDRLYLLGLGSWENDRFSGFDKRLVESVGFGYSLLHRPGLSLALEGGPALRQTHYLTTGNYDTVAGRAAVNYSWDLLPNLTFKQNASFYGEDRNSTFACNTALTIGLIGAISVQTSYLGQYENHPQPGLKHYNATSRLTLAYSF